MADNVYFLYVVVMFLILAGMAAMVAGINFGLGVPKNFVRRDWRYRFKVMFGLAVFVSFVLTVFIDWLMTPDG